MEEAVENAHTILEKAAEHDRNGSLYKLFQKAIGIALVTETDPEIAISGSVGNGIVLIKKGDSQSNDKKDKWSLPWACTLGGTGWGLGAAAKEILIFILDQETLNSFTGPIGLELSNGVSLAMGTFGNDTRVGSHFVSESGMGPASEFMANTSTPGGLVSIAFAKGTYVPATANGAEIFPDPKMSREFYGADATLEEIWRGTKLPKEEKLHSSMKKLHKKLRLLSEGKNEEVNPEAYEAEGAKNVPNEAPAAIDNVVQDVVSK
mgnify:CR=1 FL=1